MKLGGFMLLATRLATAGAEPGLVPEADAYHQLVAADRFSIGGTGPGGAIRAPERALRTIMRDPDRKRLFQAALAEATPAGQMYALCGLYYSEPQTYRDVVGSYRNSKAGFATQSGCSVIVHGAFAFHATISQLESGGFDSLERGSIEDLTQRLSDELALSYEKSHELRIALYERKNALAQLKPMPGEKPLTRTEQYKKEDEIEANFRARIRSFSAKEYTGILQALAPPTSLPATKR